MKLILTKPFCALFKSTQHVFFFVFFSNCKHGTKSSFQKRQQLHLPDWDVVPSLTSLRRLSDRGVLGFIDLARYVDGRQRELITGLLAWLRKMIQEFIACPWHKQPWQKCPPPPGVALRALLYFADLLHLLCRGWLPTICNTLPISMAGHSVNTVV